MRWPTYPTFTPVGWPLRSNAQQHDLVAAGFYALWVPTATYPTKPNRPQNGLLQTDQLNNPVGWPLRSNAQHHTL
ncbi:hypothetical protein, partial [Pontibacterium sp.]|uniref:hypothetical protein n=1 Tax=Pontibacterium sp. TaxID=2036026 RepID=UPI0035195D90